MNGIFIEYSLLNGIFIDMRMECLVNEIVFMTLPILCLGFLEGYRSC